MNTMSLKENTSDTHLTFSQIYSGSSQTLVSRLVELQKHTISRRQAEEWVEQLRFLSIDDVGEHYRPSRKRRRLTEGADTCHVTVRTLPLTGRHEDEGRPYIAVSWRWEYEKPQHQDPPAYEYRIKRPGKRPHPSEVPSVHLDRAIVFAQAHSIGLIWIDKECIYQEQAVNRTVGMQAMDLVYSQSKFSVGLLMVVIETQRQVDCLSKLLSQAVFVKQTEEPRFKRTTNNDMIRGILEVLQRLLSDERWERSWIFQEDHCSSTRMRLLVRHSDSISKSNQFGRIPGELEIPVYLLRRTATMFFMACDERNYKYDEKLLARIKQYNIWNKIYRPSMESSFGSTPTGLEWAGDDDAPWLQSSSLGILSDIEERKSKFVADRLPIYANCCKFSSRLEPKSVTSAGYGLSTCILGLCLLSGEIFKNDKQVRSSQDAPDIFGSTLHEFLGELLLEFNDHRMSLIEHFRFIHVKLTRYGTETEGWLWKLSEAITFEDVDLDTERHENVSSYEGDLDPGQKRVLWIMVRKLNSRGYYEFADYLVQYMRDDKKESTTSRREFINLMIEAVSEAVENHKPLRLGWLDAKDHPSGIFVSPLEEFGDCNPPMAFTSWSRGAGTRLDKFVSIEVRKGNTCVNGKQRLYARSWMNGIWDARGCRKERFVFPWPFGSGNS